MKLPASLLLASLLVALPAHAADWRVIAAAESQGKPIELVINTETIVIDKYDRNGTGTASNYRISATMAYVDNGEKMAFLSVIDADECVKQNQGMLINAGPDINAEPLVIQWSSTGNTLQDAQGQWMCGFLKSRLNQAPKSKTPPPPVKYTM